ncbi:hypothetical protein, partial [Caballeronia terrestris]|uniref:hypothetical protein n=1 Tax=Caballeronia terrestris TaxID=1226301 RepID=UPI001F1B047D
LGVSQLLICTYPHAALGFARFCKTDFLSGADKSPKSDGQKNAAPGGGIFHHYLHNGASKDRR